MDFEKRLNELVEEAHNAGVDRGEVVTILEVKRFALMNEADYHGETGS